MSSTTKPFEEKMNASVNHLVHELASIRAGRANPAILDKVAVDYYGSPTPIQQIAAVAVAEARILTISPWDRSMLKPISKAIQTSDIGINPIDDGQVIRLVFPAPTEERRKQLTKDVKKQGEDAKTAVRNIRRDAMDKFKAMKKAGEITEDDQKKLEEETEKEREKREKRAAKMQAARENYNRQLEQVNTAKKPQQGSKKKQPKEEPKDKRASTTEAGRVGNRPYARGRAYSEKHYDE